MGYRHIENLYKDQKIMLFRECYALEKIHGTSAHIKWTWGQPLHFFSGGVPHLAFVNIFDQEKLLSLIAKNPRLDGGDFTIYGEAYGGKCQGMKETYGEALRFTAFEVERAGKWFGVERAEEFVRSLELDFVPYEKCSTDIDSLNYQRDRDSLVAVKPGCMREGVVLRSPVEFQDPRIIVKHKRPEFSERASKRDTNPDPAVQLALDTANVIADEWVTDMRLTHVLDKMEGERDMSRVPDVIFAMTEDVLREGKGEFEDCREVRKAIGKRAATLYKKLVTTL